MRRVQSIVGDKDCTASLRVCAFKKDLCTGTRIHAHLLQRGLLDRNSHAANSLISMYAKCGAHLQARCVLEALPHRDVVSWTALIQGYVQHGHGKEALNCFQQMQDEGLSPNAFTFACILKACGSSGSADKGEQIHDSIAKQGLLGKNMVLGNQLVDMYANCGALTKAHQVLLELPARDTISWSTLIAGYARWGQAEEALNCLAQMQQEGLSPDAVTYTSILSACGSLRALDKGKCIHDEIARHGLLSTHTGLGNALVHMYAKCGDLVKAEQVLKELPVRNVVSWSALIAGYAQHGQGDKALDCYDRMQREALSPNAVTYACILKACGSIGAADKGEQVHDAIAREGLLENDCVLGTALVDMYTKCGCLLKAHQVLEQLPAQNVFSWNALMAGYAQQGQSQNVLNCFELMQSRGISPDAVTFSCVLNICSHSGLIEEGQMLFANMSTKYGVEPSIEHYACMADLFGRAGHLDKAVAIIRKMPSSNYSVVWSALLGACQKWGDVNVGRWAFEGAVQADKQDDTAYVVMAKIYTSAGMHKDAEKIEAMRAEVRSEEARTMAVG